MTLHELLTALSPSLHPGRVKDLKTAVRYLAHALGAADPMQCREADYRLPWIELKARLDHLLTTRQASPYTIRNVHNNLSYLFRQAQAAGLLTIPITRRPLQRRQDIERVHRASSPYRTRFSHPPYSLPFARWPHAVQKSWQAFSEKVTLRLRPSSLSMTRHKLEFYLGFLVHIQGRQIRRWTELFDVEQVNAYVHWHAKRLGTGITVQGITIAERVAAIASHEGLPQAATLRAYLKSLPKPEPMHDKRHNRASLQDLLTTAHYLFR